MCVCGCCVYGYSTGERERERAFDFSKRLLTVTLYTYSSYLYILLLLLLYGRRRRRCASRFPLEFVNRANFIILIHWSYRLYMDDKHARYSETVAFLNPFWAAVCVTNIGIYYIIMTVLSKPIRERWVAAGYMYGGGDLYVLLGHSYYYYIIISTRRRRRDA